MSDAKKDPLSYRFFSLENEHEIFQSKSNHRINYIIIIISYYHHRRNNHQLKQLLWSWSYTQSIIKLCYI